MKILLITLLTLLFVSFSAAQEKPATINDLKWIAGCWEINNPEKKFLNTEQWMMPAGNAMIGMSRTVSKGKMVGYEFLRLVEDGGVINYISRPHQNKEETAFKLIRWSNSEAVFENPTHDFPQRVMYRREGQKLFARIEGKKDGKLFGIDYPMNRVTCE